MGTDPRSTQPGTTRPHRAPVQPVRARGPSCARQLGRHPKPIRGLSSGFRAATLVQAWSRPSRLRIPLPIQRLPAVLVRPSHDRVDTGGRTRLAREMVHAWCPAIMRGGGQVWGDCERQIRSASGPRLALGPLALALEAELAKQPARFSWSLRKIHDPHLDMMKPRHDLQSLNTADSALGDTS